MYGKIYESMFYGSMRGSGGAFFAVWSYVISHMKPDGDHGMKVEINPDIIAFLIGEPESVIREKLAIMCAPDPKSRSREEEGRKLIQLGEYTYLVVNGLAYHKIRNDLDRREYNRVKQAEHRAKKKTASEPATKVEALKETPA